MTLVSVDLFYCDVVCSQRKRSHLCLEVLVLRQILCVFRGITGTLTAQEVSDKRKRTASDSHFEASTV